jgi:phosphatidylglycerophosphate synthase
MSTIHEAPMARRVLATRNRSWARRSAAWLAARNVQPNTVSMASIGCAAIGAAAFAASARRPASTQSALLIAAAACIQLRLLCNMLDGMLAVEGGLKTKTGDVFNELPDRLADILILAGAGYAVRHVQHGPALGWAAASLALLTAYIRALSGSLGLPQHFLGPMAKQHRMFVLTVATIAAAIEAQVAPPHRALVAGLIVIVLGSIATLWRRTALLLREANAR